MKSAGKGLSANLFSYIETYVNTIKIDKINMNCFDLKMYHNEIFLSDMNYSMLPFC